MCVSEYLNNHFKIDDSALPVIQSREDIIWIAAKVG